eukprot:m.96175 g.96175  ORF g.96175 m.96175 type:complete len:113 (-) comp21968_c0_seq2:1349-1687(-)
MSWSEQGLDSRPNDGVFILAGSDDSLPSGRPSTGRNGRTMPAIRSSFFKLCRMHVKHTEAAISTSSSNMSSIRAETHATALTSNLVRLISESLDNFEHSNINLFQRVIPRCR